MSKEPKTPFIAKLISRKIWLNATSYPDPHQKFVFLNRSDLSKTLRRCIYFIYFIMIIFLVTIVGAFTGLFIFPTWAFDIVAVLMSFYMVISQRNLRHGWYGTLLWQKYPDWTETWIEIGIPISRVWMMIKNSVNIDFFAEYVQAIGEDTDLWENNQIDPRFIWWLYDQNINPEDIKPYREKKIHTLDAVHMIKDNITVEQWFTLLNKNIKLKSEKPNTILNFYDMIKNTRFSENQQNFQKKKLFPPELSKKPFLLLQHGKPPLKTVSQFSNIKKTIKKPHNKLKILNSGVTWQVLPPHGFNWQTLV